ncbi:MAG: hypothetical protein ACK5V1_04625 [Planctomycetaceae bacterium]
MEEEQAWSRAAAREARDEASTGALVPPPVGPMQAAPEPLAGLERDSPPAQHWAPAPVVGRERVAPPGPAAVRSLPPNQAVPPRHQPRRDTRDTRPGHPAARHTAGTAATRQPTTPASPPDHAQPVSRAAGPQVAPREASAWPLVAAVGERSTPRCGAR